MRTISDTITRLHALRAMHSADRGAGSGGRLLELSAFGSNPGNLRAKFFRPEALAANSPLVVVLHGCTQTAEAYDHGSGWSMLAEREGFAVLFAEQRRENNANLCFNWFIPDDTQRDSGEVLSIRQMIDAVVAAHAIDRDRIFVTGLSAGGAMAATMLATHPEIFAGGAIIAGLPHGVAQNIPQAFDRMRGHGLPDAEGLRDRLGAASDHAGPWPLISIWHGDADQTVSSANAESIAAQWHGALGTKSAPTRIDAVDGQRRRVWCDSSGRERMESWTIAAMGHGTPIDSSGHDAVGVSGPFMLDAGISSTLHTARFWRIAPPTAKTQAPSEKARKTVSKPPAAQKSESVGKVIEAALRTAGLLR